MAILSFINFLKLLYGIHVMYIKRNENSTYKNIKLKSIAFLILDLTIIA